MNKKFCWPTRWLNNADQHTPLTLLMPEIFEYFIQVLFSAPTPPQMPALCPRNGLLRVVLERPLLEESVIIWQM